MFTVKLENRYGEVLELTHNADYTVQSITGLGPVQANINTDSMATMDGTRYNSSRKGERNIVITAVIKGNIEQNRLKLYKFAPTKYPVRFYFKNDSRNVYIDGYVETHEINLFENRQRAQISILCPQPFFRSVDGVDVEFSSIFPLFKFSFFTNEEKPIVFSEITQKNDTNVINEGDVETGILIELHALGTVINPIIYNRDTRERFAITFTMKEGDVIRINTNAGEKSVVLIRDGTESNIINSVSMNNDWFVLRYGDNIFTYECTVGYESLILKISVANKFEGV